MDLNLWSIFASLFLVSVGAVRFDLGPQRFTESASPSSLEEANNGANEIVLYLTPEQIKSLEASGAVVRPDDSENDFETPEPTEENDDSQVSLDADPNADSDENQQNESENAENNQEEEPEQSEEPVPETIIEDLNGDIDFEEIFRILNEEQLEEEEEAAAPEEPRQAPQVVENVEEEPREIPARFLVRERQQQQKQREDRYLVPAEKKARSKTFSSIRYQQTEEPAQKPRAQLIPQVQQPQEVVVQQNQAAELLKSISVPLRRFRLVPYEIEEKIEEPVQEQSTSEQQESQPEEQDQQEEPKPSEEANAEEDDLEKLSALLTPLANPEKFTKVIGQRKSKLYQNEIELKAALRDLKLSPKTNDQKFAIEIERLKANLEKQNTLSKAEALAKAAPHLIKKEIQKRRQNNPAKQIKSSEVQIQKTKLQPVAVENVKPFPVPKKQEKKVDAEKATPTEAEKRAPAPATRNVYVKVSKPYERIVPVEIREGVSELPVRKNEKITILRHIWEH